VDGQDVVAVWEVAEAAVKRARADEGPTLIEAKTYRYHGHHQGDDTLRYRLKEEEQAARARDCLKQFRAKMEKSGPLKLAKLDGIDAQNKKLIDNAVEFAKSSLVPEPHELYTDVYVPARDMADVPDPTVAPPKFSDLRL
jgi:TPP-dependent pyruvate/acetoin dehydrogenase alpha subunit